MFRADVVVGVSLTAVALGATAMQAQGAIISNLLSDPGFEAITGTAPDAATTPWFTVGDNDNSIRPNSSRTITTSRVRSGSESALFQFYFTHAYIAQRIPGVIDASKSYELSTWMLLDDKHPTSTHATRMNLVLFTQGGTFIGGAFGLAPSAAGQWQQFSVTFTPAQLAAFNGAAVEARIFRVNPAASISPLPATDYRMWVDDAAFGVVVPEPASFLPLAATVVGLRRRTRR
jgi:hypothetical protein